MNLFDLKLIIYTMLSCSVISHFIISSEKKTNSCINDTSDNYDDIHPEYTNDVHTHICIFKLNFRGECCNNCASVKSVVIYDFGQAVFSPLIESTLRLVNNEYQKCLHNEAHKNEIIMSESRLEKFITHTHRRGDLNGALIKID